jgi:hypothetical protein
MYVCKAREISKQSKRKYLSTKEDKYETLSTLALIAFISAQNWSQFEMLKISSQPPFERKISASKQINLYPVNPSPVYNISLFISNSFITTIANL